MSVQVVEDSQRCRRRCVNVNLIDIGEIEVNGGDAPPPGRLQLINAKSGLIGNSSILNLAAAKLG